mgnify:CR=1 FL=1|tara:strand:- start:2647 stop:2862 length:216 start_codon:yes stop_codon:yes gene_type:complete
MSVKGELEKGYDYCYTVIDSCNTKEQLNDASNLVESYLTMHGESAMRNYVFLQNQIFNRKLELNNATGDTE